MSGQVALHGGGEYVRGDEPAMDALLAAAIAARGPEDRPVRVVLVPSAAARQRPDMAVSYGRRAFAEAAVRAGVEVAVEAAMVVDAASAADRANAVVLAAADLVHLPGGDPDLIPAILGGSAAWDAALQAFDRGACLAGASAGAMALAERLWTARGPVDGLGVVRGVAVLPHFDGRRATEWRRIVDPDGRLGWLGLDERTLVIGPPGGPWTVAGAGRAHLFAPGGTTPVSAAAGERLGPPVG